MALMNNQRTGLVALTFIVALLYFLRWPTLFCQWALLKGWEAGWLFVPWVWSSIPSYLPFYLLVIVCLYAAFKGHKRATVIAPFHCPPDNQLPFGEHTVAHALQDAFINIREKSEKGIVAQSNSPIGHVLPGLEGFQLPAAPPFEVPTRFAVEVKGISHEALISLGRKVLGKERVISGDVIVDGTGFRLLARSGPYVWSSSVALRTMEGLHDACHELAVSALESYDPMLLATYEISEGKFEDSYQRLLQMMRDAQEH